MQRYWDLSDKERSELSSDEVKSFLDYELMEKGIVKVKPPALEPVEEVEIPTTEFYQIQNGSYGTDFNGFAFTNMADAEAFTRLSIVDVNSDWNTDVKHASPYKNSLSVVRVNLVRFEDYNAHKIEAEKRAAANKRNKDAKEQFAKAQKEQQDAVSSIWNDWHKCRGLVEDHQRVIDTRNEYLRLCDNDPKVADRFLAKAFDPERIRDAFAWFGIPAPSSDEALPESSVDEANEALAQI